MKSKRAENIEKLLRCGREKMALQQKSLATERQYLHYAKRFLWFTFELDPKLSSEKKVEAFLTRMAVRQTSLVVEPLRMVGMERAAGLLTNTL